jgi:MFS family permease
MPCHPFSFLHAEIKLTCAHSADRNLNCTSMDRKWWLVIAGCITHAVNTGFSYFGMSAFFPSFEREFGWSRTGISGAFSLARIESGLLGPVEGYLTDRVGAHRMLFIGLVVCTLGFLALSRVDSLPIFML